MKEGHHDECDMRAGRGYKTSMINNKQILALMSCCSSRLAAEAWGNDHATSSEQVLQLPKYGVYHLCMPRWEDR
jgi:hypothetical protein